MKHFLVLSVMVALTACHSPRRAGSRLADRPMQAAVPPGEADVRRLMTTVRALGPGVAESEAARAAQVALDVTEAARRKHGLTGTAIGRNLAINLRLHAWGLCWHWTEHLGSALQSEQFRTLDVRWACAHAGSTLREHNAVVLAARGRPLADGLVVDPWRQSGRLTWVRVADDRYPWKHEPWSEARWRAAKPSGG